MPKQKEETTENYEFNLPVITNKSYVQKQQRTVLLEAINDYIKWRNNQSAPDNRGFQITIFTWFRHYTAFGEARANGLKNSLASDLMPDPLCVLKKHFESNSKIENHSLDTYLLENILKNIQFFNISVEGISLKNKSSREALRRLIMAHEVYSEAEYDDIAIKHDPDALEEPQLDELLNSTDITIEKLTIIASQYYKNRVYTCAKKCFEKLGQLYEIDGAQNNKTLAFRFYLKAAELGSIESLCPLDRLGEEVSSKEQLALSQVCNTIFHDSEKASYWHGKSMEIEPFHMSMN